MTGPETAAETARAADAEPAGKKIEGRSPWRLAYERLRNDRTAKIAAGTILVIVLLAICAPVFAAITGHGPDQQFINIGENANGGPVPPNGTFWFGTDSNGRDLFVRVLYGARVSLLVGVLATAISVALGVVFGLAAGYIGGLVDSLIARVIDVMLSIPLLLIAISVAYIWGPSIWLVIVIVGALSFTSPAPGRARWPGRSRAGSARRPASCRSSMICTSTSRSTCNTATGRGMCCTA